MKYTAHIFQSHLLMVLVLCSCSAPKSVDRQRTFEMPAINVGSDIMDALVFSEENEVPLRLRRHAQTPTLNWDEAVLCVDNDELLVEVPYTYEHGCDLTIHENVKNAFEDEAIYQKGCVQHVCFAKSRHMDEVFVFIVNYIPDENCFPELDPINNPISIGNIPGNFSGMITINNIEVGKHLLGWQLANGHVIGGATPAFVIVELQDVTTEVRKNAISKMHATSPSQICYYTETCYYYKVQVGEYETINSNGCRFTGWECTSNYRSITIQDILDEMAINQSYVHCCGGGPSIPIPNDPCSQLNNILNEDRDTLNDYYLFY